MPADNKVNLREYKNLIETIAKVEYQSFLFRILLSCQNLLISAIIHFTCFSKIISPKIITTLTFLPQSSGLLEMKSEEDINGTL